MNSNVLLPESPQTPPASPTPAPQTVWTRRRFLRSAAVSGAVLSVVPRHVLGAPGVPTPNSRVQLAGVGVGGVGFGQIQSCEQAGFHVAALCDVDDAYANKYLQEPYQNGWSLENI